MQRRRCVAIGQSVVTLTVNNTVVGRQPGVITYQTDEFVPLETVGQTCVGKLMLQF